MKVASKVTDARARELVKMVIEHADLMDKWAIDMKSYGNSDMAGKMLKHASRQRHELFRKGLVE